MGAGQDEAEWWTGNRARVFISCGQRGQEAKAAAQIRDLVRSIGFVPYLAIEVHSSKGLTEGIYEHLRTAEYFLFIDFPRETISEKGEARGSLFSHQELAIASALGLDILPFLDTRVKREGILDYIQGNPVEFTPASDLLDLVRDNIRLAAWNPGDRKELAIRRHADEVTPEVIPQLDPQSGKKVGLEVRYFHLRLQNLHSRILATGCFLFVEQVRKKGEEWAKSPDVVELKFKHVNSPTVSIPAGSFREFDGLLVPVLKPSMAIIGILNPTHLDSARAVEEHKLFGPGDFEIDLVAYSREFACKRATLQVHLGAKIEEVRVALKD